jgi:hypothetical protein
VDRNDPAIEASGIEVAQVQCDILKVYGVTNPYRSRSFGEAKNFGITVAWLTAVLWESRRLQTL